jgi:hypothetical protein
MRDIGQDAAIIEGIWGGAQVAQPMQLQARQEPLFGRHSQGQLSDGRVVPFVPARSVTTAGPLQPRGLFMPVGAVLARRRPAAMQLLLPRTQNWAI